MYMTGTCVYTDLLNDQELPPILLVSDWRRRHLLECISEWVHCKQQFAMFSGFLFLYPRHKMARGNLVFALSVIPPFHRIKVCLLNSSYILHGFEWNLVQMLYHKSRSACGEIIHVRQILAELWPFTLRIFTHFSLSSQLLLQPCMDLNETWQGCCTTSLEVHVGR